MKQLVQKIRNCKECNEHLPFGANPIIAASSNCKLIIIGQAPGRIVHQTGIPWNDKSGDNLRTWLGIE
jgi:uracil-DNA glycosylase